MQLAALTARLEPHRRRPRWWVAYSGGLDSHVLLHLLAGLCRAGGWPPLAAIHVNHGLTPRADAWAGHCRRVCAALGVELVVAAVRVERRGGQGLEAAARAARYRAFTDALGGGELLLQAHHRDDQAETLLLRLLRGSGVAGLAGIPAQRPLGRGELLRPLLDCTRAELLDYARQQQLVWIEDDSNVDEGFDRNFLRHRVLPLLAGRWPGYRDTLARLCAQAAESAELLEALAGVDAAAAQCGDTLDAAACLALSPARQRNLLRHWLAQRGLPAPGRAQLEQLRAQLPAVADAELCVTWPGAEVRRHQGRLYAMAPLPAPPEDVDIAWSPPHALLPQALGELRAESASGRGLRAGGSYRVRSRRGGERCRPQGRAHSQTLKKLLQEAGVPPWWRDRLPLIYCGEQLAAVADLWVCEGFGAGVDEPGWVLHWRPPATSQIEQEGGFC